MMLADDPEVDAFLERIAAAQNAFNGLTPEQKREAAREAGAAFVLHAFNRAAQNAGAAGDDGRLYIGGGKTRIKLPRWLTPANIRKAGEFLTVLNALRGYLGAGALPR